MVLEILGLSVERVSIPHIHKWFSSLSLPKPIVYDVGLVIEND
jgi:hypothetical protein